MARLLPTAFASAALFSTYYLALPDDYPPVQANMTAFQEDEMAAALELVLLPGTTKLFVKVSGDWNDANNWYPTGVPSTSAKVVIPEGCTCNYNKNDSTTKLGSVRIDGTLSGDISKSVAMLFDTMVGTPTSLFQDGTRANPVPIAFTHEWIIATSNGLIDVSYDRYMQSRGVLWIGSCVMWGAAKVPFAECVNHTTPNAGATSMGLDRAIDWAIGDEIVIGATKLRGNEYVPGVGGVRNADRIDEKTLTGVSGTTISWAGGLTYDHRGPANGTNRTDLKAYVINLTRNIKFRPDDPNAPIHHGGHTMFMHNPLNIDVRYVEFSHLGRTSKMTGFDGRITTSISGTWAAGVAVDMTGSPLWDGTGIVLGPSFSIEFLFGTAAANGTLDVEGLDEDGNFATSSVAYTAGNWAGIDNARYNKVTKISSSTNVTTKGQIYVNSRGRQRNNNGVRCFNILDGTALPYATIKNTMNIQGRYPAHFHKHGVLGSIILNPPKMIGCSVHHSPGWAVAHHQSHCIIKDFVSYDTRGGGLIGEDGNEGGIWFNCVVIKCRYGLDGTFKGTQPYYDHDPANGGFAYFLAGRNIHLGRCVAISAYGGHIFNVRLAYSFQINELQHDYPSDKEGDEFSDADDLPIRHNEDNIAFACDVGFHVVKANGAQQHDVRIPIRRYKAVSCYNGVDITYVHHYSVIDADVVRGDVSLYNGAVPTTIGIGIGDSNVFDMAFINPKCDGFTYAVSLYHNVAGVGDPGPQTDRWIVNPQFTNCDNDYLYFDASLDHILATGDLNSATMTLTGISGTGGTGAQTFTATKHDAIGDIAWLYGASEAKTMAAADIMRLSSSFKGYWTDAANSNHKTVFTDLWFSDRTTGNVDKVLQPIDINSYVYTPYVAGYGAQQNNGACDTSINTAPIFSDFTVSVVKNTNKIVDIVGRASGSTLRFGGMERGMKTDRVNNGDGTVTLIPLADELYTETVPVWVDNKNGKTTRAWMTINVAEAAATTTSTGGGGTWYDNPPRKRKKHHADEEHHPKPPEIIKIGPAPKPKRPILTLPPKKASKPVQPKALEALAESKFNAEKLRSDTHRKRLRDDDEWFLLN